MKDKDHKMLQEAYGQIISRPQYPLKKTWDWDDEIEVDGVNYFAQANYTKEDHYDEGDGTHTPPTSWVSTEIDTYKGAPDVEFYKENPETGDFDIPVTQEQEPELFEKLFDALDQKIYKFESER